MKVFSNLGKSAELQLTRAILLYESRHNESCAATIHQVSIDGERATLGPGECPTVEGLQDLAIRLLQRNATIDLIPPNLLASGIKGMAWYCPPSIQQLWFDPHDKAEKAALKPLSGERFPQPGLVFVADEGLRVFAVRGGARPSAKTPLFFAPYMNISPEGLLCTGDAGFPLSSTPPLIAKFEKAFFESNFTHSNYHARFVNWEGGHNGLWKSLKNRRRFPDGALLPIKRGRKQLALRDLL